MSLVVTEVLSSIFSFIPLAHREELGATSSKFVLSIKQSKVSQTDLSMFEKTRRAAFFDRHLDKVDWNAISCNKLLPVDFFRRHEREVNWKLLSSNPAIPYDLLENHLTEIDWDKLSANWAVPIEFFEKHSDEGGDHVEGQITDKKFYWHSVFWSHKIKPDLIEKCSGICVLCESPYPDIEILDKYKQESKLTESDRANMIMSRTLPVEWLETHIDEVARNRRTVSWNDRTPIAFFERHIECIEWEDLVQNKAVPVEFFEQHFDKFSSNALCVQLLTTNPNMPAEFFETRSQFVDWRIVLANCKLSLVFLERYYNYLDWEAISGNSSVPIEFFEMHLDKIDWNKLCLGHNTNRGHLVEQKTQIQYYCHNQPATNIQPWPQRG